MDLYTWVIFMYVAGTILIGWFLLHESSTPGHRMKKDGLVAPANIYAATASHEDAVAERTLKFSEVDTDFLWTELERTACPSLAAHNAGS